MWFSHHPAVRQPDRAGGDHPDTDRTRSGTPPSGVVARTAGAGLSGRVPAAAHDCRRTRERRADFLLPLVGGGLNSATPTFTAHRFVSGTDCSSDHQRKALRGAGPRDWMSDWTETQPRTQGIANR